MFELPMLVTGEDGRTVWQIRALGRETRGGLLLSPRVRAGSLRLRESEAGYATGWHVAGEPVLILVRRGVLRIETRGGAVRDFGPGDGFIAADALEEGVVFDESLHGHRAEVVGDERLEAVHIKLEGCALADGPTITGP